MSQPATSSRLNNSSVNINGATTATSTNFGLARIGVTGNSFDISSSSGTVTLGITGTGNVQLGNATSGAVSFPGTTTFTTLNGATTTSAINIGSNLITGGTVVLGSTASTTNLYGTLDITEIEGPSGGSNLNIGRNITSGSITIGNTASNNTVTIGNNGVGPTGTVNVGLSSASVNICNTLNIANTATDFNIGVNATGAGVTLANGSSFSGSIGIGANSASRAGNFNIGILGTGPITLGSTGAPLTLRGSSTTFSSPLTLGAAPTISSQLGSVSPGSYNFVSPNETVTTTNSPYNLGTATFSTPGVWIVSYYIAGTASTNPSGSVQVYSTASGAGNSTAGASTAPLQQTLVTGTSGIVFAGGSFVTTITTSVVYNVYINVIAGTFFNQRSNCYFNFTRIG